MPGTSRTLYHCLLNERMNEHRAASSQFHLKIKGHDVQFSGMNSGEEKGSKDGNLPFLFPINSD